MRNVKLFKAAITLGNSIFILIGIISGIDGALSSDKFPVDLAFVALLIIPLIMLIIYGLRAYQTKNDSDSYFALLAISVLLAIFQLLMILALIMDPKLFLPELPFVVFSTIMLLLWVLNVIAYLKGGNK